MNRLTREEYINALAAILTVKPEFDGLHYLDITTKDGNKSYLMLKLITGSVVTFNVTDYTDEQIFHIIAMLECGQVSQSRVTDTDELIEVGRQLRQRRSA